MPITAAYAGLFGLLFALLSARVINFRRRGLGTPDNPENWRLKRAIRGHGNFAEYVPLVLVLMLLLEMNAMPAFIIHAIGLALLIGRTCHAVAFSTENGVFQFRVIGTAFTLTALIVAALANLAGLF